MNPKLDIFEERDGYGIAWFDEDGEGLRLGDSPESENCPTPPKNPDLAEHWHAYQAAIKSLGVELSWNAAPRWDSMSSAKKALSAARAAVKIAASNKPWPEWARQALAAGWKAPKGWKP